MKAIGPTTSEETDKPKNYMPPYYLSYVGYKKQFTGTNNFSGLFFKKVLGNPFKLGYMIRVIGVQHDFQQFFNSIVTFLFIVGVSREKD